MVYFQLSHGYILLEKKYKFFRLLFFHNIFSQSVTNGVLSGIDAVKQGYFVYLLNGIT